jgi:hypothetical protein
MDGLIMVVIIMVLYYVLDDVITQFLLAIVLLGIFTKISNFITVGTINILYYELIIGILILVCFGKVFWLLKKKGVNHA